MRTRKARLFPARAGRKTAGGQGLLKTSARLRAALKGRGPFEKKTEYWCTAEGLALLEGWARDGVSEKDIAARCGVSVPQLRRWRAQFPEMDEALRQEKDAADYQVEAALWRSAVNGSTTAQIYWLKNRRGGAWRDKPEPDETASFEDCLAAVTGDEF